MKDEDIKADTWLQYITGVGSRVAGVFDNPTSSLLGLFELLFQHSATYKRRGGALNPQTGRLLHVVQGQFATLEQSIRNTDLSSQELMRADEEVLARVQETLAGTHQGPDRVLMELLTGLSAGDRDSIRRLIALQTGNGEQYMFLPAMLPEGFERVVESEALRGTDIQRYCFDPNKIHIALPRQEGSQIIQAGARELELVVASLHAAQPRKILGVSRGNTSLFLKGEPVLQTVAQESSTYETPLELSSRRRNKTRWRYIALAAAVTTVVVGYSLLFGRNNETPTEPSAPTQIHRPVQDEPQRPAAPANKQPVDPVSPPRIKKPEQDDLERKVDKVPITRTTPKPSPSKPKYHRPNPQQRPSEEEVYQELRKELADLLVSRRVELYNQQREDAAPWQKISKEVLSEARDLCSVTYVLAQVYSELSDLEKVESTLRRGIKAGCVSQSSSLMTFYGGTGTSPERAYEQAESALDEYIEWFHDNEEKKVFIKGMKAMVLFHKLVEGYADKDTRRRLEDELNDLFTSDCLPVSSYAMANTLHSYAKHIADDNPREALRWYKKMDEKYAQSKKLGYEIDLSEMLRLQKKIDTLQKRVGNGE